MKLNQFFSTGKTGDFVALIAGALTTLAFAPFHIFPLAILSISILFGLWLPVSEKRAFWRGYLFGLGLFSTGIYWVYISIHTFGNVAAGLSVIITAGLIALLALFPALSGYFANKFFPTNTNIKILCVFPAFWLLLEWIRSWIFTGFPWLFLGYTQIYSPLKGYAAVLSVYGVSLAVLLSSALIVKTILHFQRKESSRAYSSLLFIVLIWISGGILSLIPWTQKQGDPIKVSLVQGDISQSVKWSPDFLQTTLNTYQKLSEDHWDSKLVIWPEAAIPVAYQSALEYLDNMNELAKSHHSNFITGIPIKILGTQNYFNAVIMLGEHSGYYLKRRLVPFGEYIPFHGIFHKLFDVLNIPMSDFIPAIQNPKPLQIDNIKITVFICYEITFPEMVIFRDGKINMLLTVSNDAWFDHSIAQAQHLEMGQMRSLEMGRPGLFASNSGITAVITPHGQIQVAAPQYQPYVLTAEVQPMQGKTPWQRYGTTPVLSIMILMILLAIRERRGR